MDEAERLCDNIAIIVAGKIIAQGTPQALIAQTGKETLEDAFVTLAGRDALSISHYTNGNTEDSRQLSAIS